MPHLLVNLGSDYLPLGRKSQAVACRLPPEAIIYEGPSFLGFWLKGKKVWLDSRKKKIAFAYIQAWPG